jgi:copper(I)-binding protein
MLKRLLLATLLSLAAFLPPAMAAQQLTVEDAWIREAPPGAPMLAGYLILHNHSDQERALVAAESPAFGMVELHRTVLEDGMARMVAQKRIPVPAGGQAALKPGDYHLMLMKPQQPLKAGDTADLTLHFDDGSSMTIQAVVRRATMDGMQHNHSHGDHTHQH